MAQEYADEHRLIRYRGGQARDITAFAGTLQAVDELNALSVEERRKLPGMPERRAEIIDYGAAILVSFLRMAGLEGLYVSDRDNLYSAVMMDW